MGRKKHKRRDPIDRFVEKIDINDGCWLWTACISREGYGQFSVDRRPVWAHRWAYETWVGPIPEGLELDHLCKVRNCTNPGHLEPVTHAENIRRGDTGKHFAERTYCPKGHQYDEANTKIVPSSILHNGRRCRECSREYNRAWRKKNRAYRNEYNRLYRARQRAEILASTFQES